MAASTSKLKSLGTGQKVLAGLALAYASFAWSLTPIFIRLLSHSYDPFTQIVMRYGTAAIVLTVVCLTFYRAEFLCALRQSRRILPLALVIVCHQYVWTAANYGATPTVAQLTTKLSIVLVVVFSFIMFHEERAVIRHPYYLIGTLLSLAGMTGVLAKDPYSLVPNLDRFALLLLMTALLWAVYVVWAKHLVGDIDPVPLFTVLALWATLGFIVLAVALGDMHRIVDAGPRVTAIAIVSGIIPIALAHPAYHHAQRALGAALCSSLNLMNPLLTYAFALLIWPDEHLMPSQWAGAAVLLAGTLLVTLAAQRAGRHVIELPASDR
ncbi:MAG: DMT family transporter [FCB group bacterium]|jgi:drug/metabolite transporter (DMT)-like permease|nr:DMT family transporter [FCB group bacterium]